MTGNIDDSNLFRARPLDPAIENEVAGMSILTGLIRLT